MDELLSAALALLPTSGSVEFDVYKKQLYTAIPEQGRDLFARIIKGGLCVKTLGAKKDGKFPVLLSRLP